MVDDPLAVLEYAVAVGLPGAPVAPEPPVFTTEALNLATAHRVEGLVQLAIGTGRVSASPLTTADVEHAWLFAAQRSVAAERWAAETVRALDDAGVATRVLKGIAIAHLDHDDPGERMFGDADVLVRRADHRRALAALTTAGFRRVEPPVRQWWERRFSKAIMLRTPSGGELDLHLSIVGGYFGARVDHRSLWDVEPDTFDLDGLTVHALDHEGRWLHACCHAVLGGGSGLRATRDVAQLALAHGLDWQRIVARATTDGVDAVVAHAVRDTWHRLGLDPAHPLAQWATQHMATADQQRALAAQRLTDTAGWGSEGWATLPALGSLDRLRFVCGVLFPSRASLRYRGRSRAAHLRSTVSAVWHLLVRRG